MDSDVAEIFKAAFGTPGEPVPTVDVADLKAMWAAAPYGRRDNVATGMAAAISKQICSQGADMRAVSYRCGKLGLIELIMRAAWTGGELSEAAFKVAAKMDMKWMAVGVIGKLGVQSFVAQHTARPRPNKIRCARP